MTLFLTNGASRVDSQGTSMAAYPDVARSIAERRFYRTLRHRRLHPAFGWGAALVTLSWPLRLLLAGTPQWTRFAA